MGLAPAPPPVLSDSAQPEIVITGKPFPRLSASPECLLHIKNEETGGVWDGKRLKLLPQGTPALAAYPDSGGVWTAGWGATGPDIHKGVRWTLLECELRFEADVIAREASLRVALRGAPCTIKQFEAMLCLGFNIAGPHLQTLINSTLFKKHMARDYAGAALEFLRWDHDNGKVVAGLTARREREKAVYEGGSW